MPLTLAFTGKVAGDSHVRRDGHRPDGQLPVHGKAGVRPRRRTRARSSPRSDLRRTSASNQTGRRTSDRAARHCMLRTASGRTPTHLGRRRHDRDRIEGVDRLAMLVVGGPFDAGDALRLRPRRHQFASPRLRDEACRRAAPASASADRRRRRRAADAARTACSSWQAASRSPPCASPRRRAR